MLQPKILNVEPRGSDKLRLYYENGEIRLFDVRPYMSGEWYGQLEDENYFATVNVINGGTGIEWAEGQDIAPHELYELSVPVNNAFSAHMGENNTERL